MLGLYRDRYFDLNLRRFHEKLVQQPQIRLSYSLVKEVLPGGGAWWRWGASRGVHRKRGPRWPLPGIPLHIDESQHRWF